jgi:hypothetical protein
VSEPLIVQPDAAAGVDAYLSSGIYSNLNLGSANLAYVGSTFGKNPITYHFLLRFDLSAVPTGAVITAARLVLTKNSGIYNTGAEFQAQRLTRQNWTELGATWDVYDGVHAWTSPGGDVAIEHAASATLAAADTELVIESLAPLAADAIWYRERRLDLLVRGLVADDGYAVFYTSDDTTADLRPKLIVDYVAAPTLELVDNGDGTGATATIGDVAAESATTVFVRSFSGELGGTSDWIVRGARAGSGTLALDLPPGHYLAYAATSADSMRLTSTVVYFAVTDGLEAIHARCLDAVQARIRLLLLDGLTDERIIVEKVPVVRAMGDDIELPVIVLTPQRAVTPAEAGTNGADDVHYDVLVTIVDRDNQEPTLVEKLDQHLLWRQQIAKAFRNQRLPGVPEVINAAVDPAEGLQEHAWRRELMVSALRLRFTSRESRGF